MTNPDQARSADAEPSATAGPHLNVGSFRFWFVGQRWEWSDEVARMHGYEPGSVVPTTDLLLSHKHPDDRQHVQDQLDHLLHFGGSFSSRHRFIDTAGREHTVIVLADRMLDGNGAVVGSEGYYIDLTDTFHQARRQALDDSLPELFEARAAIEQAKGALMIASTPTRRSRSCCGAHSRPTPSCGRWHLRSSPNSTRCGISRTACGGSSIICC